MTYPVRTMGALAAITTIGCRCDEPSGMGAFSTEDWEVEDQTVEEVYVQEHDYAPSVPGGNPIDDPARVLAAARDLNDMHYAAPIVANRLDPQLKDAVRAFQQDNIALLRYLVGLKLPGADAACGDADGLLGVCTYAAIKLVKQGGKPSPGPEPTYPLDPLEPEKPGGGGGLLDWIKRHPLATTIILTTAAGVVVLVVRHRKKIVRRYYHHVAA